MGLNTDMWSIGWKKGESLGLTAVGSMISKGLMSWRANTWSQLKSLVLRDEQDFLSLLVGGSYGSLTVSSDLGWGYDWQWLVELSDPSIYQDWSTNPPNVWLFSCAHLVHPGRPEPDRVSESVGYLSPEMSVVKFHNLYFWSQRQKSGDKSLTEPRSYPKDNELGNEQVGK